jgi:hypothetical protein
MKIKICILLILISAACTKPPRVDSSTVSPVVGPKPAPTSVYPDVPVAQMIKELPFLEPPKKRSLSRVWKQVPGNEFYRMIRASDFRTSETVDNNRYQADVAPAAGWGSDYGELSGAYGLAAFIVDKRIATKDRFSIVVFIERKNDRYSLHWVIRNQDLSNVTMGRHSGNVYLTEAREDKTTRFCDIKWDRITRKWDCKLNQVK